MFRQVGRALIKVVSTSICLRSRSVRLYRSPRAIKTPAFEGADSPCLNHNLSNEIACPIAGSACRAAESNVGASATVSCVNLFGAKNYAHPASSVSGL